MSWPSMRLLTVTILKAPTEPNPFRYTGMSPLRADATATGTPCESDLDPSFVGGVWLGPCFSSSLYPPKASMANADNQSHHRLFERALLEFRPGSRCGSTSFGSITVRAFTFICVPSQQDPAIGEPAVCTEAGKRSPKNNTAPHSGLHSL